MSEILIDLVKNSTLEVTNKLLAAIASNTGGLTIKSFADLQQLTRLGLASKVVSIGDQISCEKATSITAAVSGTGVTAATVDFEKFRKATKTTAGAYAFNYDGAWKLDGKAADIAAYGITVTGTPANGDTITVTEKAKTLVWDVLGIDCDTPADSQFTHSITLGLHDCLAGMVFDAREALFYCPDGLAAGTYNFKVTQHTWVSSDVNKTFQFTLAQAVPAGGQIVLQVSYNVTIAGSTLKTYASASATTEIETATITEGTGGTSLGDVNNAINGNTNSLQRGLFGNNRYSVSAMRQYLNSSAAAGSVWTPKHNFDRAPSWATSTAGFLNGMDEDFLSVIGEVTKVTALNTVSDGGGSETTTERFFLLSRSEVYGGNEVTGGEGAAYPSYANYSDLAAPGTENDTNRIKYRNGSAQYWWLRSPNAGHAYSVRYVDTAGGVNGSSASYATGVAPACCIV